jgi:hypothetical protein
MLGLYLARSAGKSPGPSGSPVPLSISMEWDWLGAETFEINATHFAAAGKPSRKKMKLTLNRWTANSPTYTNQFFPGIQLFETM